MNLNRETILSNKFESGGLDPKPNDWVTLGDPDPNYLSLRFVLLSGKKIKGSGPIFF